MNTKLMPQLHFHLDEAKYREKKRPPKGAPEGPFAFQVSGRYVTYIARSHWLNGYPDKALRLIKEGCLGMTEALALEIVTGSKSLWGWNDLEVKDDDEAMPSLIQIMRAIRMREDIEHDEAVRAQARFEFIVQNTNWAAMGKWTRQKVFYYLKTGLNPMSANWSEARNNPDFDPEENLDALNELIAEINAEVEAADAEMHAKLDQISAEEDAEEEREEREEQEREATRRDPLDELFADARRRIAASDMPADMKERMLRASKGQQELYSGKEVAIAVDEACEHDTGWLAPDGKFYGCEAFQHIALAHALAKRNYRSKDDAEQVLEKRNWMKVSVRVWHGEPSRLTQAQKDTLFQWCTKHGKLDNLEWGGVKTTYAEVIEGE